MIIGTCRSLINGMSNVDQCMQLFKAYSNIVGGHVSLRLYVDYLSTSRNINTPDDLSLKISILFINSNDFILFYCTEELNQLLENNKKMQLLASIENFLKNKSYHDIFIKGISKIDLITNENTIFQESNDKSFKNIMLNNIDRIVFIIQSEEISRLPKLTKGNEHSKILSDLYVLMKLPMQTSQNNDKPQKIQPTINYPIISNESSLPYNNIIQTNSNPERNGNAKINDPQIFYSQNKPKNDGSENYNVSIGINPNLHNDQKTFFDPKDKEITEKLKEYNVANVNNIMNNLNPNVHKFTDILMFPNGRNYQNNPEEKLIIPGNVGKKFDDELQFKENSFKHTVDLVYLNR